MMTENDMYNELRHRTQRLATNADARRTQFGEVQPEVVQSAAADAAATGATPLPLLAAARCCVDGVMRPLRSRASRDASRAPVACPNDEAAPTAAASARGMAAAVLNSGQKKWDRRKTIIIIRHWPTFLRRGDTTSHKHRHIIIMSLDN